MHNLSGMGAFKVGGRWNPPGFACLYTSQHISLCILEKLVHTQQIGDMQDVALMTFEVIHPDKLYVVDPLKLKKNWQKDIRYTQWIGSQILGFDDYSGFIVPSVIVPSELNIILHANPTEAKGVVQTEAVSFEFDMRLKHRLNL
jgi:RES domain-containing protein